MVELLHQEVMKATKAIINEDYSLYMWLLVVMKFLKWITILGCLSIVCNAKLSKDFDFDIFGLNVWKIKEW
jgi:hypothetical protein